MNINHGTSRPTLPEEDPIYTYGYMEVSSTSKPKNNHAIVGALIGDPLAYWQPVINSQGSQGSQIFRRGLPLWKRASKKTMKPNVRRQLEVDRANRRATIQARKQELAQQLQSLVSGLGGIGLGTSSIGPGTKYLPINESFLTNVGREGHTFFKYIYDNYDNLDDYTIFLQGHPYDHSPDLNNIIIIYGL
jgi:hypothetical protein